MNTSIRLMTVLFLSAVLSCDDGSASTNAAGATSTDCPIGMFRPEGLADCVFPAENTFGQPATVSDNRCATGQPAFPPSCISDTGRRAYLSASHTCAPNYHFESGVCQRGDTGGMTGTGGFFTGFAGFTGAAGSTDTGGFSGAAGSTNTGGFTGGAGSTNTGGAGTTPTGGSTGQTGCGGLCSDASTDTQQTN